MFWYSLLASVALKGTAVLATAWIAARLLSGRSAAARHLVWTAAAAALLALPLFLVSVPALQFGVDSKWLPPGVVFSTTVTGSAEAASSSVSTAIAALSQPRPLDWGSMAVSVWSAGAAVIFAQMLVALVAIWRTRRRAARFVEPDLPLLAQSLGIEHAVDLVETRRGSMPMVFGLFRSTVFLPQDAAEWTSDRRRVVLLHELAHVRRGDVATHLLARMALSLYWWNPLAWLAWREFLNERERAADDLVLQTGARASDYAGHLLEIARTMHALPSVAWASVPMARQSRLQSRLRAILDAQVKRGAPGRGWALAAALVTLSIVVPLAAVQAQTPATNPAPVRQPAPAPGPTIRTNVTVVAQASPVAQAPVTQPETPGSWLREGVLLMSKDLELAVTNFLLVERDNPKLHSQATMWIAIARDRQGKFGEAENLFKEAIATAEPNSLEAVTVVDLYARFLRRQKRDEEAAPVEAKVEEFRSAQAALNRQSFRSTAFLPAPGVKNPRLVFRVEPAYTDEARAAKYQGTVLMQVIIGTDGVPHDITVVRGLGLGLDEKAMEAVSQWKFQPGATADGQLVEVRASIEVNFRLL